MWKCISVLHFPKGKNIKWKGIFNIIDIRATVSEFSEFSGNRHLKKIQQVTEENSISRVLKGLNYFSVSTHYNNSH